MSKTNNWIDENGNVYLIFTTKDLCEILNCGTQKVTKIKKELENFNLLEQERMGLNKPNKIYILEPKNPSETNDNKEFRKSKSNDTELNDTDYIKTENNDLNDTSTNTHSNYQKTEFNNDALKFQVLEILPNQMKDYLSNFEILRG